MLFGKHCPKCLYTLIINYGGYIKIPIERLWRRKKKELSGDHTPEKGLGKGRLFIQKHVCVDHSAAQVASLTVERKKNFASDQSEQNCFLKPEQVKKMVWIELARPPTPHLCSWKISWLISQNHTLKVIDFVRKMGLGLATQNLCNSSLAGEPTKTVTALLKRPVPSTDIWPSESQWLHSSPCTLRLWLPLSTAVSPF